VSIWVDIWDKVKVYVGQKLRIICGVGYELVYDVSDYSSGDPFSGVNC